VSLLFLLIITLEPNHSLKNIQMLCHHSLHHNQQICFYWNVQLESFNPQNLIVLKQMSGN